MNKTQAEHPSLSRARITATALGSTATTARGIARYLSGHHPTAKPLTRLIAIDRRAELNARVESLTAAVAITEARRDLDRLPQLIIRQARAPRQAVSDAERMARRARDDRRFRRSHLAKLKRREKAAVSYPLTLAGVTQRADSGKARTAELAEVARLRSVISGKPCAAIALPAISGAVKVPVDTHAAKLSHASIDMRGKDATLAPTFRNSHGNHSAGETEWKNGRPKHYTRATHDNYVRSFAIIDGDKRSIAYACHQREATVPLPDGYLWNVDANGLRVVDATARHVDYHPTASDLLRKDAATHLITTLEANRAQRERLKAERTVEAARVAGVYVCLADALRAGNCRAGCEQFAARHGLDPRRHYAAPELLEMANGDASRVRLTVTAARLRHEKEMAQGFALLSEHAA